MEPRTKRYLRFVLERDAIGIWKTQVWNVYSVSRGLLLGRIAWYGAWFQYAFSPEPETVFNAECLKDITAFIKDLTKERGR